MNKQVQGRPWYAVYARFLVLQSTDSQSHST